MKSISQKRLSQKWSMLNQLESQNCALIVIEDIHITYQE